MKKSYEQLHLNLKKNEKSFNITLGRINCYSAQHPMKLEAHEDLFEILYLVKGKQVYSINNIDYLVSSGDVILIFPSEEHSSGQYPFDKALMYYFHIDLAKHQNDIIGYVPDEGKYIVDSLKGIKKRVFKGNHNLQYYLDKIINLHHDECYYKNTLIRNYISLFLINILECSMKSDKFSLFANISNTLKYIDSNIKDNIKIETLAKIANLSISRFKACFREQVGMPPREYILRQKIEKAKDLLNSEKQSITDISYNLSFSSSQYFATVFKKFTYYTPKEFRQLTDKTKV